MQRHGLKLPKPNQWVYLWSEIDASSIKETTESIMSKFEKNNRAEIVLYLNCSGGDLGESTSFYHLMRFWKVNLITIGVGEIASSAFVIFLSGNKRYILPDTVFYFHEGTIGTKDDMALGEYEALGKRHTHDVEVCEKIVCAETKLTQTKLRTFESQCYLMREREAVHVGIADRIVSKPLPKLKIPYRRTEGAKLRVIK